MSVSTRRYERLHFLFATFRRDQLEAFAEILDPSQWSELMLLYREMALDEEKAEKGETSASRPDALTTLSR
jgi:hypothetical protein